MKKIVYQAPEVKVKALIVEQLMAASTGGFVDGNKEIEYDGEDDGTHDPDAKEGFVTSSVWDD